MIKPAESRLEAVWLPLPLRWAQDSDETALQVRWWIEDEHLLWEMKTPLPLEDRAIFKAGGFAEGLWEQDVAEFFVADPETGHYQEFNLSPGGAWWSAIFSGPRVRMEPQPDWREFDVQTEVQWTGREWIGCFSLPLSKFMRAAFEAPLPDAPNSHHATDRLRPEPGRRCLAVNFTAIRASTAGRRFYSLAPLAGEAPDFHRPWDWIVM